MIRSCWPPASFSSSPARNMPDCLRSWSTRVVLPWSTWAMMATLRMGRAAAEGEAVGDVGDVWADWVMAGQGSGDVGAKGREPDRRAASRCTDGPNGGWEGSIGGGIGHSGGPGGHHRGLLWAPD